MFENLLRVYQVSEPDQQVTLGLYNELFTSVQQMIASPNPEVVNGVLLVCQGALLNIRPISMLAKVFSGVAALLCNTASNYI